MRERHLQPGFYYSLKPNLPSIHLIGIEADGTVKWRWGDEGKIRTMPERDMLAGIIEDMYYHGAKLFLQEERRHGRTV